MHVQGHACQAAGVGVAALRWVGQRVEGGLIWWGGDRKGAELHLPDICGWMAGCSLPLSSCAWMVSTTRLKRLLGPDGGNQGNAGQALSVSPRGSRRYYNNTTSMEQTPPSEREWVESARCGRSYPIT